MELQDDGRPRLKDGYEYVEPAPSLVMRLIDPDTCPQGHPMTVVRRGWSRCDAHDHHNQWTCACGQQVWRAAGEFVGEAGCVDPNYGQQL